MAIHTIHIVHPIHHSPFIPFIPFIPFMCGGYPPIYSGERMLEDLGYRDIPVASLTAPWAAAHGASWVTGGSILTKAQERKELSSPL